MFEELDLLLESFDSTDDSGDSTMESLDEMLLCDDDAIGAFAFESLINYDEEIDGAMESIFTDITLNADKRSASFSSWLENLTASNTHTLKKVSRLVKRYDSITDKSKLSASGLVGNTTMAYTLQDAIKAHAGYVTLMNTVAKSVDAVMPSSIKEISTPEGIERVGKKIADINTIFLNKTPGLSLGSLETKTARGSYGLCNITFVNKAKVKNISNKDVMAQLPAVAKFLDGKVEDIYDKALEVNVKIINNLKKLINEAEVIISKNRKETGLISSATREANKPAKYAKKALMNIRYYFYSLSSMIRSLAIGFSRISNGMAISYASIARRYLSRIELPVNFRDAF